MHTIFSLIGSQLKDSELNFKVPGGVEEQTNKSLPGSSGCVLQTNRKITEVMGAVALTMLLIL